MICWTACSHLSRRARRSLYSPFRFPTDRLRNRIESPSHRLQHPKFKPPRPTRRAHCTGIATPPFSGAIVPYQTVFAAQSHYCASASGQTMQIVCNEGPSDTAVQRQAPSQATGLQALMLSVAIRSMTQARIVDPKTHRNNHQTDNSPRLSSSLATRILLWLFKLMLD